MPTTYCHHFEKVYTLFCAKVNDPYSFIYVLTLGPSLELEQVNTTNADCVQLLCTLDDINQEQVDFIWNINGQNTSGQVQVINSSFNVSSSLRLCGSEWRDGDTITCSVSHLSGHITSSRIIPAQKGKQCL